MHVWGDRGEGSTCINEQCLKLEKKKNKARNDISMLFSEGEMEKGRKKLFFFFAKTPHMHFDFEHALRKCTVCCIDIEVIKCQWLEFFLHLTLYVNIILEDFFSTIL